MASLGNGGDGVATGTISAISGTNSSVGSGNCGSQCNSEHKGEVMVRGVALPDVSFR